jgi:hypothetical protein
MTTATAAGSMIWMLRCVFQSRRGLEGQVLFNVPSKIAKP